MACAVSDIRPRRTRLGLVVDLVEPPIRTCGFAGLFGVRVLSCGPRCEDCLLSKYRVDGLDAVHSIDGSA